MSSTTQMTSSMPRRRSAGDHHHLSCIRADLRRGGFRYGSPQMGRHEGQQRVVAQGDRRRCRRNRSVCVRFNRTARRATTRCNGQPSMPPAPAPVALRVERHEPREVPPDQPPCYVIRYQYPGDEKAARDKTARAAWARRQAEEQEIALRKEQTDAAHNVRYVAMGDASIGPTEIFDDGYTTQLRFPGNLRIPAILTVARGRQGEQSHWHHRRGQRRGEAARGHAHAAPARGQPRAVHIQPGIQPDRSRSRHWHHQPGGGSGGKATMSGSAPSAATTVVAPTVTAGPWRKILIYVGVIGGIGLVFRVLLRGRSAIPSPPQAG